MDEKREKELLKEAEDYKEEDPKKEKKKTEAMNNLFSRKGQIESFYELHPFFYDKAGIFWLWEDDMKKWEISDEVDFLVSIQRELGIDTINSKARSELINGFKQVGREKMPEMSEKNWVQFRDKIYDLKTGDIIESSPKYFVTNPIPYKVGESSETPNIDKLFTEWVGEDHKEQLYEFIAYAISSNQFMQRIFAFCGGGSNGKGTFIKLVYKFIGQENTISSEIKAISEDKFETAVLYRKLLCVMGEVSANDLKNTNQLKKIGGEDKMSFQFKGKTPFTDDNIATCVCLTNSLPATPDKSIGFYRKWMIIDFPNQFQGVKKNLIENIPDQEFENLARKSLETLKKLYETKEFTLEGDFQERMQKYEERSNPLIKFIDNHCDEVEGAMITLRCFTNHCNDYLKERHLRILNARQIAKSLTNEGFIVGNRYVDGISAKAIINLKLKKKDDFDEKSDKTGQITTKNLQNYQTSHSSSICKTNQEIDSNGSFLKVEDHDKTEKQKMMEMYENADFLNDEEKEKAKEVLDQEYGK